MRPWDVIADARSFHNVCERVCLILSALIISASAPDNLCSHDVCERVRLPLSARKMSDRAYFSRMSRPGGVCLGLAASHIRAGPALSLAAPSPLNPRPWTPQP